MDTSAFEQGRKCFDLCGEQIAFVENSAGYLTAQFEMFQDVLDFKRVISREFIDGKPEE
ncbi:MAG: hypothetical protein HQ561_02535 [Desulfobacteraceae bacterium]|nr:hypothetical protein [Desulfobacteraceae bacterium]